jgi:predicted dehydrogenase
MLKAETAGSGCMTNLGVHFLDMALLLTGSASAEVLGSAFHYVTGYDVEDYAATLVRLSSGATMTLETAYAYPMDKDNKRDNHWNFTTKNGYYTIGDGRIESRVYGAEPSVTYLSTDTDGYYATYTAETCANTSRGRSRPPVWTTCCARASCSTRFIEKARG